MFRVGHAFNRCVRGEGRAPHDQKRPFVGSRILEELEIGVHAHQDFVENELVTGYLRLVPLRFGHHQSDPVLSPLGQLGHKSVLRAEVVRREASADSGTPTDAGERRSLDPAFGDDLGCRLQERIFGAAPPFGLASSLEYLRHQGQHTCLSTNKQVCC